MLNCKIIFSISEPLFKTLSIKGIKIDSRIVKYNNITILFIQKALMFLINVNDIKIRLDGKPVNLGYKKIKN